MSYCTPVLYTSKNMISEKDRKRSIKINEKLPGLQTNIKCWNISQNHETSALNHYHYKQKQMNYKD